MIIVMMDHNNYNDNDEPSSVQHKTDHYHSANGNFYDLM